MNEALRDLDLRPPFVLERGLSSDFDWDIVDSHPTIHGALGGTFDENFGRLVVVALNEHFANHFGGDDDTLDPWFDRVSKIVGDSQDK